MLSIWTSLKFYGFLSKEGWRTENSSPLSISQRNTFTQSSKTKYLTNDFRSGRIVFNFSTRLISLTTGSVWSSLNTSNIASKASDFTQISLSLHTTSSNNTPISCGNVIALIFLPYNSEFNPFPSKPCFFVSAVNVF